MDAVADYPVKDKIGDGLKVTTTAATDDSEGHHTHKVHWYRGTTMQIWVVGLVFLCAPGMYNALSNLGAGGLATPYWANATNAAGYAFMCFTAVFGGIVVSKLGVPLSLFICTTGDIIYSGTLYANSKTGVQYPLMIGSIYSGITDGFLYSIEGPIVTGYPEPDRRGRLMGIWVALRQVFLEVPALNAGPVIGGAIILGVNHSADSTGAVSLTTYIIILAIMCLGPFISLLISRPEKVQRRDGVDIKMEKLSWKEGCKGWWKVASNKDIVLLCPMFFCSWFQGSYIGTLQTIYFSVRTRSLFSFTIPFADILSGLALGVFLDAKRFSIKQKVRWTFGFLVTMNIALWIWTAIVTHQLDVENPAIDWDDAVWMGRLFPLFLLWDFVTMLWQTFLFWCMAEMSKSFMTLSFATGTLRGVECAGQAVAYGVKASKTNDWISVGLNMGLIAISLPSAWMVFRKFGTDNPPLLDSMDTVAVTLSPQMPSEDGDSRQEKGDH